MSEWYSIYGGLKEGRCSGKMETDVVYWTLGDLAEKLGYSRKWLREKYKKLGHPKGVKYKKTYLVHPKDVNEVMEVLGNNKQPTKVAR